MNERTVGGEPVADLRVRHARLRGIDVPPEWVPLAIDEFPALFVAAACAQGRTRVTGAEELRVKESDRIAVMADGLQALGVDARPTEDGMVIAGAGSSNETELRPVFRSGRIASHGDHRIAMSFAIAALRSGGTIVIDDTVNVATSFPGFVELSRAAGLDIAAR
jgi:3-phosphoshikimate 1-carboxyvinyltransferase